MAEKITVRVKVSPDLWQKLRIRAAERRTSARDLTAEAIKQYLERKRK